MQLGLALPQYDYSVAGERPLRWDTIRSAARLAERVGYDSVWLSDHLFLDIGKYGGPDDVEGAFEPLVTLGALSRAVPRVRLGTLVLCEALRPASVMAKTLATLDRLAGGRLDVGIGAGWYEPEYAAIGMDMPGPGERLARLREAVEVLRRTLGGEDATFEGRYHSVRDARVDPPSAQRPRPPLLIGGTGDRLLRIVAELADGWNTCWVWTPEQYRERVAVLDAACEAVGRDPATVHRSLGLYALCGEDRRDLERRFERLRTTMPGVLAGKDLDQWRVGRLVGTIDEVAAQVEAWQALGVDSLVANVGAVPFQVGDLEDVELVARAVAAAGGATGGR